MRTKSISQVTLAQTQKQLFLQHYAQLGTIGKAAEAAGIARRTAQYWLEQDADFKADLEQAKAAFAEKLEHEMYRRAHDGWDEPVFWQGEDTGNRVRKYSDTLLIFSLKGAAPEKYKDRFDHSGTGAPGQTIINVVLRSPEELAQLERELRLLDQQQRLSGDSRGLLLPPGQVQEQQGQ